MSYINPLYQYWRPEETSSPSEDRAYALTYYHSLLYHLSMNNPWGVEKRIETIKKRLEELT